VKSFAQTDTSFWFAAPEVCLGNFVPYLDRPVRFVVSSYSTPATVTISQPANPGFTPIVVNIPANNYSSIDLSTWLNTVECKPANTVLNYGFHISSTTVITVYYEVVSPGNNPEIFPLKGKNALGVNFFIPSQKQFENSLGYPNDPPRNSFDIVATENGTVVTITPAQNIVGHAAGVSFTINLNKGQVYSATASSGTPAGHLSGSKVVSNKPIAITIKDDLIRPFSLPCADLMGDQIVPVDNLGNEHVLIRGYLNYPPTINAEDFYYILAVQDTTTISVNGVYVATINQGVTQGGSFTGVSAYIQTDKPVYVIHVSGTGCEMAEALIPPIPCSGSSEVSFTRTSAQNFGLLLMAPAGAVGSFSINTPLSITPANFTAVPGTGGQWFAANINCSPLEIPVGQNIRVTNSSDLFHLGIINYGSAPGGCRYGYFSDYNSVNLIQADSLLLCSGDSVLISAPSYMDTYNWSNGDTSSSIYVTSPGYYYLTTINTYCSFYDSVYVKLNAVNLNLGNDTTVCYNQNVNIGVSGFLNYLWSTGDTTSFISAVDTGLYYLQVSNAFGCFDSDTLHVAHFDQYEVLDLGVDQSFCNSSVPVMIGDSGFETYLWNTGDTLSFLNVDTSGQYILQTTDTFQCFFYDTVQIAYYSVLLDMGPDTMLCSGVDLQLNGPGGFDYLWNTGDTTSSIFTSGPGNYVLTITDQNGCSNNDSIQLVWNPLPYFDFGPDTSLCYGNNLTLSVAGFEAYNWNTTPLDTSAILTSGPGTYILTVTQNNCSFTDSISIGWNMADVYLGPDLVACSNDTVTLGVPGFSSYQWNTLDSSAFISVFTTGLYSVQVVDSNGCAASDSVIVNVALPINLQIGNDSTICAGDSILISAPTGFVNYAWNVGGIENFIYTDLPGSYILTVTDTNNCFDSDTLVLYTNPLPVSVLPSSVSCITDSILLDAGNGGDTYLWSNGATTPTTYAFSSGAYTVQIMLNNCSITDTVIVNLAESNEFSLGDDTTICSGEFINLSVQEGYDQYLWSTGETDWSVQVNQAGVYWVMVNSCGYQMSDTIQVGLYASPNLITVPNVFTPNGDGVNDIFLIGNIATEPELFELLIYDRWGVLLFRSNSYLIGWNGIAEGGETTDGVYYYILNIHTDCNESVQRTGFITLFK
jgi:gliding motility-associated-like protein